MFRHPAWAEGSYSSGPAAAKTYGTKSTEGFHQRFGSPCISSKYVFPIYFGFSFYFQRDPDGAAGRSVRVCVEAAGDAGGPDALQAHAAGADIHQDLAQDPAAGESLDYQKCSEMKSDISVIV